jgi:hypothetical protein
MLYLELRALGVDIRTGEIPDGLGLSDRELAAIKARVEGEGVLLESHLYCY